MKRDFEKTSKIFNEAITIVSKEYSKLFVQQGWIHQIRAYLRKFSKTTLCFKLYHTLLELLWEPPHPSNPKVHVGSFVG